MPSPYAFTVGDRVLFDPMPGPQLAFMQAREPNVFLYGNRGGGKSIALRMVGHAYSRAYPGFRYIIVRRSFPELTKNHLIYLDSEMKLLGGTYNKTEHVCYYPDDSIGFYAQCASAEDVKKVVGAEAALIGFDEAPELEWDWMRLIAASARVPKGAPFTPMTRYVGNPIGPGIEKLWQYCIDKDVDRLDDPEYVPDDWRTIEIRLEQNVYLDPVQYRKQFAGIPAHIRKAWLDGLRVVDGAYFVIDPAIHHTEDYPDLTGAFVYRAVDWGWHEPWVCLWIAVYPSGRAVVVKERSGTHMPAQVVASLIKAESQGMRVVETYADPSMFAPEDSGLMKEASIFEAIGIGMTKSKNDRTAAGYAVAEWLNVLLADGFPRLQIYATQCPMLVKTLPNMRMDPKEPGRLADGHDHWVIALAYFCMAASATPREIRTVQTPSGYARQIHRPGWAGHRRRLGSESVRR